jgi:hypothetical protein
MKKKTNVSKLKFEKLTVAKLNNLIQIKGGYRDGHDTEKPKDGGPDIPHDGL